METNIRCNNCMWIGKEEDLVLCVDDGENIKGCPNCKTDNYLMDVEKEQEVKSVKVYKYDELSENAKQVIYNNYYKNFDYPWRSENSKSLSEFCKIFDVDLNEVNFDYRYASYSVNLDDDILELKGLRLHRYIMNNYFDYIHRGKYYSSNGSYVDGKYNYTYRHSNVILERSCVFTGYYMDEVLLNDMYKFIDSPKDFSETITLEELIEMCLDNYIKSWNEDYDIMISKEYFEEEVIPAEYSENFYLSDGTEINVSNEEFIIC